MPNFIRFTDNFAIKQIDASAEERDFYNQQALAGNTTHPLRVHVAATHAGRLTRNKGLYLPDKMRAGVSTWTVPFAKPILVHHDSYNDPVGRVFAANYVDLSISFKDELKKGKFSSQITDSTVDAFIQGILSKKATLDFVDRLVNDLVISTDPTYEGLGYIELIIDVTDPTAIQKILDKRYLTGSVGASTDSATCSICQQDWAGDEGPCDHKLGEMHDGKLCFLVAGNLQYEEWSFVNKPADTLSKVIEINNSAGQDFIQVGNSGTLPEVALIFDNYTEEAGRMSEVKDEAKPSTTETKNPVETQKDEIKKEETVQEDIVKVFFGESYDELVGDDPAGRHYVEMLYSLVELAQNEDEKKLATKIVMDAKLSSAARKKMSTSTFCKPGERKYPVPDCSHAKSAMAYAKKYNESSSVVACIRRKAARLGCPFDGKSKDSFDVGQFLPDYFDSFEDSELQQMFHGLLHVMEERGLKVENSSAEAELSVLKDEKVALEAKVVNLEQTNTGLVQDVDHLNDALATSQSAVKQAKVEKLIDLKRLACEEVDVDKITTEFASKSLEDCSTVLDDYTKRVDLTVIIGKLKSGLANNPSGEVEDPTLKQDNSVRHTTSETSVEQLKTIYEQYIYVRMRNGQVAADAWLDNLKKQGIIPIESPFKTLETDQS